ncbi:MAG: hypothetical protein FJ100_05375 [Deltaproteobacteria bacterium]|nr:hypothetical protein [Deltaproteobacteria bacterium]
MTQARVCVVTAGGTREPIDEVRAIANTASGALPCALALRLVAEGWRVHYVCGPGAQRPDRGQLDVPLQGATFSSVLAHVEHLVRSRLDALASGRMVVHPVGTAAEAGDALARLCRELQPDAVVCAMAVADFAPRPVAGKLMSRKDSLGGGADGTPESLTLELAPTAKAIDRVKREAPRTWLLGFKLLAGADRETLVRAAAHLAQRSGADAVFANDIRDHRAGLRRGLVVDRQGAVVAELPGGAGDDGLRALADQLGRFVVQRAG